MQHLNFNSRAGGVQVSARKSWVVSSGRGNTELVAERHDANLVLTAHELLLVLRRITAHQQPMNHLGHASLPMGELTELQGLRQLAQFEIGLGHLFERPPVEILQAALLRQVPLARDVIFK